MRQILYWRRVGQCSVQAGAIEQMCGNRQEWLWVDRFVGRQGVRRGYLAFKSLSVMLKNLAETPHSSIVNDGRLGGDRVIDKCS